jgi:hypothetical protein
LDADYVSGLTLTVKNNSSFAANDILVVGETGQEGTEAVAIASLTGKATITLKSALRFAHNKGMTIYRCEYDFAAIYVSMVSSGLTWVALSESPLQWDRTETIYVHQGGLSSYSYKFRFRNSQTANVSEYSPTITGAGFAKNTVGYLVQQVRKVIIDPDGNIVSNSDIIRYLNEGKKIIEGVRNDWWFWKKEDKTLLKTVASQQEYNLDTISTKIEYIGDVRYNFNDGTRDDTWHLKHLTDVEYDYEARDETATTDDELSYYNIKAPDSSSTAGYLRVWPIPTTTDRGTFYVRYYQPDTDFDDIADTTAITYPQVLIDYAIARCEQVKGDDERADKFMKLFYGPQIGRAKYDNPTGIALLNLLQRGKLRPLKQPRSLKTFRGRLAMRRFFKDHEVNRDSLAENYFDYPSR